MKAMVPVVQNIIPNQTHAIEKKTGGEKKKNITSLGGTYLSIRIEIATMVKARRVPTLTCIKFF
jgi:hypothetical protein